MFYECISFCLNNFRLSQNNLDFVISNRNAIKTINIVPVVKETYNCIIVYTCVIKTAIR